MFTHDFVRHAWLAGTGVGVCCGVVGWFVVLRAQVFAGDALSHVAFVGAIGAALVGVDVRVGLFVLTGLVALAMAGLGRRARASDEVIGIVFAWVLGVGLLLLALLATSAAGGTGVAATNALFGSIYSLSLGQAVTAAGVGAGIALTVLVAVRPLLLASLEGELASLLGVPVRTLGTAFLLAVGALTADGTQAVGALLVLGLLAAPAGAAHHLAASPARGLAISTAVALASVWIGLTVSYLVPALPASSAIVVLAAGTYAAAFLWSHRRAPAAVG